MEWLFGLMLAMRAANAVQTARAPSTVRVWNNGWRGRVLRDASRQGRMPAANAAPPHHRRAGCKPRGGLAFKPQPSQLVQRANFHIQAAKQGVRATHGVVTP